MWWVKDKKGGNIFSMINGLSHLAIHCSTSHYSDEGAHSVPLPTYPLPLCLGFYYDLSAVFLPWHCFCSSQVCFPILSSRILMKPVLLCVCCPRSTAMSVRSEELIIVDAFWLRRQNTRSRAASISERTRPLQCLLPTSSCARTLCALQVPRGVCHYCYVAPPTAFYWSENARSSDYRGNWEKSILISTGNICLCAPSARGGLTGRFSVRG